MAVTTQQNNLMSHPSAKLLISNMVLCNEIKIIQEKNGKLARRKSILEKQLKAEGFSNLKQFVQKRKRRKKSQLRRHYCCPFPGCLKRYASDNSCNQHLKIKHVKFWKYMRESLGKHQFYIKYQQQQRPGEQLRDLNRMGKHYENYRQKWKNQHRVEGTKGKKDAGKDTWDKENHIDDAISNDDLQF